MAFSIKLNQSSGVPFYRQIVDQVRFAVLNGRAKPGEQLPTVRGLAVDLKINLNTVSRAYRELELAGWVVSQQGTGTFISETPPRDDKAAKQDQLIQLCDSFVQQLTEQQIPLEEALQLLQQRINKK